MLIVFQNVNLISIIPALMLGMVFDVYYLRSSERLRKLGIFQQYQKRLPIQCLPLGSAESMEGVRYHDYGIEALVYRRVDQLIPTKLLQGLGSEFSGISCLDQKLRLALAGYLGYLDIGAVTLFIGATRKYRRICFVHATLTSYLHRVSNVPDSVFLHHVFFPADDLAGLFSKAVGKVVGRIKNVLSPRLRQVATQVSAPSQQHRVLETAIAFHQTVGYGKMFRKLHYFSSKSESRLHPSKVLNLVLDRQPPISDTGRSEDLVLRDLKRISSRQNMLASARFFLSKITVARSFDEFMGVILLTRMHYAVRSWLLALQDFPELKNVIIDYDILFPKTLALALEARGIRTIALQERGSASFASIYCAMADTYLLCGGLFTEYGQRNPSIACRQAVDFGAWRTTFLIGAEVPAFKNLSIQIYGEKNVNDFTSVIAVLGWFTAEHDHESSPFINRSANLDLHKRVKSLALAFPDSAVVLRLKLLNELDRRMAFESFSGLQNIFLCDEYSKMNASYSLCKRADVIVSVQTSLADECLAAGKRVVVLDSTHNFKSICTDIYPEQFHFAFASDSQQMLDLVSRCLHGDAELVARYDRLKEQLSGKFDLRSPNIIPDVLEQCLL